MNVDQIITAVNSLGLAEGSFVVYGSGPLAAAGIREAGDIDMLVTPGVYEEYTRKDGWHIKHKGPKDTPVVKDKFELHQHWDFSAYSPTLDELLSRAKFIQGVPFASLDDVLKWKRADSPPSKKANADIAAVERYFAHNSS